MATKLIKGQFKGLYMKYTYMVNTPKQSTTLIKKRLTEQLITSCLEIFKTLISLKSKQRMFYSLAFHRESAPYSLL